MISDTYNKVTPFASCVRLSANILAIVGAINWGLIGINKFNLVAFLFGEMTTVSKTIYALVGFAGLYLLVGLVKRAINN